MQSMLKRRWLGYVAGAVTIVTGGAAGLWVGIHQVHEYQIDQRIDRFSDLIDQYATDNDLPTALVRAIVRAESGGRPRAVSKKNAVGLMQITAPAEQDVLRLRRWSGGDLTDPQYNLRIGTAYLRTLLDRFEGDLELVVAAYHMGPTGLQRLRNDYPELSSRQLIDTRVNPTTRHYCQLVRNQNP